MGEKVPAEAQRPKLNAKARLFCALPRAVHSFFKLAFLCVNFFTKHVPCWAGRTAASKSGEQAGRRLVRQHNYIMFAKASSSGACLVLRVAQSAQPKARRFLYSWVCRQDLVGKEVPSAGWVVR